VHVILENNGNDAHYLVRDEIGKPICATAQWNDDLHHALHVLTTGEADGYYADYAAAPLHSLGRALTQGFTYQGEYSEFRGRTRGEPSAALPPNAFVGFMQNHDMIGNRAFGDRIHHSAAADVLHAAYVCLLLAPEVPMLFMGEEFAASTPFLYFCDFDGNLAKSVTTGRRKEFKRFAAFAENAAVARIPDPNAEDTFTASKLQWNERARSPHREQWQRVRELLALRRRFLAPYLSNLTQGGRYEIEGSLLRAQWRLSETLRWRLLAHFATDDAYAAGARGEIVYSVGISQGSPSGDGAPRIKLAPGAVLVTVEDLHAEDL
jgi:maltooligosyltrehalose trehalohydrolase